MPRVVKRRQASPLILQQLWEAIGVIREQKQIANLERISKYMNREYDYSPKETQRQLGYAVKDGLIIREISKGNKGSKIGVEQEGYWCIEQPEKPVTDDHDWYCTECHKAGDVIRCHGCFRVAHPKCLEKNKVPPPEHGHWYCFVCTACRKKNHMIGRSEVNKLLGFALMRMKEKVRCSHSARELYKKLNLKDTPYFYSLVHTHMDLSTMQQKVDDNKYRCLEDFEGDAALMLHNNIVYYGADSERVELCDMVVDDGKHDIQEIRICKDCYKMSNCRTTKDWFCRPCTNPHDLVWAQMKGFGYWPAKVIQRKEDQVDVRFFGGLHQRAWLAESNIKDIDTDIKQLKIKATPGWHSACKELKRHQVLLAARDKSGKTEKPERPEKTHKSHKAYKSRKRSREVEETEQDDAVSSSNGDQQVKVQADNVTSSQDSNQGSPAASTESTPAKRRKSSSNTSNLSSESPTPAKCDCHEKYTTIFTDFKARLEQEYQKEKEEAITEALEKLRAEMESDKQQTISRVKDTMMAEIDRTKKQTREKCQEEFEEELKKIEAKNKEEMSQTKKRQWCINCEEEAMYHCCWNTSYCSINCQQIHWHKEHKKLCRRKR